MTESKAATFYDRISKVYDSISDASEHRVREQGEQALGLSGGEQVLEIGFGTGNSLLNLAKLVGPTGSITGLDSSTGMLAVAKEKIDRANPAATINLVSGDARELSFSDRSFDAAFMSFTLELFTPDQISVVLAEIKRVLKPGGKLAVVSMTSSPEGEPEGLMEQSYKWMHRHFPHIIDCSPIDAVGFLESAGLLVQEKTLTDIWSLPVSMVVATRPA